jgi:glucose/arabinose dehydrogenase
LRKLPILTPSLASSSLDVPAPIAFKPQYAVSLLALLQRLLSRRTAARHFARSFPGKRTRRPLVEPLESRELLTTLPAGFQETLYGDTNVNPAGMDFAPDGRLFVANKDGRVTIIEPDGTPAPQPFFSVPVDQFRDRGLTAVVVDPHYEQNHYVYVYYTPAVAVNPDMPDNGAMNRLVRLTASDANPDIADPASETVILDGIPSQTGIHQGGLLRFGADGMLYMGVGEGDVPQNAQDLSNIFGKVLRLDVENYPNTIPADNPFVGQTGVRPEIWAYGFRNPFSGGVAPGTSNVFVNDVGNNTWEEVNRLVKGGNYGWPLAEGVSDNPNFVNPLFTYNHNGEGAAVDGGTFYAGATFPAIYSGQYFVGDLVQGVIRVVNPDNGAASTFETGMALPTDIETGPDGSLYWCSIGPDFGAVYKVSYVGNANRPPLAAASADVTSGGVPLTVNFDGSASSDPDNDTLRYSWDFGDGTTGEGVSVEHTYTVKGVYSAVLTVSDRAVGGLTNSSMPLSISVGNYAPVPTITTPLSTDTYKAGQTISFSGAATDVEDGDLPVSAFHWSFLFGHNTHFHNFIGPMDGTTSGSFTIPLTGETDPNQYYRILLTVTDSEGLSTTTHVDVRPVLTTFKLDSNIAGAQLLIDGSPLTAGSSVTGVAGMTRTIEAPLTQIIGGTMYKFVGWSDSGGAQHDIATPDQATTYTAQYQAVPLAATYASTAPTHVLVGQKLTYKVTVTNIGTQTWKAKGTTRVRLGVYFGGTSDAVGDWISPPILLTLSKDIAPGKSATFTVKIAAPATAGDYVLRNRMVQDPGTLFDTMDRVSLRVDTLKATYAPTPPTTWGAGQSQQYSVTVTNTGTATWHASGPQRVQLGVYFGGKSDTPPTVAKGLQLFALPADVLAGQSATFDILVTAPKKAGSYTLRQRLVSDDLGWFADMQKMTVAVQTLLAQYMVTAPTQWQAGQAQTYTITVVNKGSQTWNAIGPNAVHLGVYFNGASDAIGDWIEEPMRFDLPHDVKPGQKVTFTITVTAPLTAGSYVLRHRMVKEGVNWFVPLAKTNVTVA